MWNVTPCASCSDLRRDDVDGDAAGPQRRRDFEADEAGTTHDDVTRRCRPFDDGAAVRERPQIANPIVLRAGDREPNGLGAGREEQRAVLTLRSIVETHHARGGVDRRHATTQNEVDALLHVELIRPERDPIVLRFTREEIFRQVRPIDGRIRVGTDHGKGAAVALAPQHLGRGHAGGPTADDHNGRRRPIGASRCGRRLRRQLLTDEQPVALAVHAPAGDRIERRRAERLPRSQAEAGVMPRTAHRVPDDEPFDERAAIVRTRRANGEQLVAGTCQHDLVVADAAENHAAVLQ
jgi:hypothetical protein